jgi:DNA replication and repair protein RecF
VYLKKLALINFKNYESAELLFSEGANCFYGLNGEGKTNLVDAIYYLSFCKSFFNPIDSQNIKHGSDFFMIQGEFVLENKEDVIYCGVKLNQKKQFKKNKKEYAKLADHIGNYPLIIISPEDNELVTGGSELRRKLLDGFISQYNSNYLENLINYNKALLQRNSLLKQFSISGKFDSTSLELWDNQLVQYGYPVHDARKSFIRDYIPIFQEHYTNLSGGKEKVGINYESQLNDAFFDKLLITNQQADRQRQHTTIGVHKDDLVFLLNGYPAKKFGSQGQQKSFVVALKLALYEYLKSLKKKKPVLLLDDIFDKLDSTRVQSLMKLVAQDEFGQIFITDTDGKRISDIFKKIKVPLKMFQIISGTIQEK